jgi:ribosomal protein S18 acetylase RimI-like enzyme
MIRYSYDTNDIVDTQVGGFFVGWPDPPNNKTFLTLLKASERVLALDDHRLVGFITAHTDGVLSAYIPLLEVLPEYQKQGIGKELVKRMFERLKNLYMIDLVCDDDLIPFYEKLGMSKSTGMIFRNYKRQSGNLHEHTNQN